MNTSTNITEKAETLQVCGRLITLAFIIAIIILAFAFGHKTGKMEMVNEICNLHEYPFCKVNEPKQTKNYTYEPKRIITEEEVEWLMNM